MAYVIVSADHLTDSRPRTLRARPVLIAAAASTLLLMAACVALGFKLAQWAAPRHAAAAGHIDQPELLALVGQVGRLAGRLTQLEQQAATLAQRLGDVPVVATLAPAPGARSSGGPAVPLDGIAEIETGVARLEGTLGQLSERATERDLVAMAYPNRLPVAGSRAPVSSQFGTREDPFTGRLARHTGLDIPARYGTPILASGGGRVVVAGRKGAYGQTVIIDHGDGLATLYGHASKLLVRAGDVVLPQQAIALVGSTGRSTGAHLHFEVIRNGSRVEPRQFLAQVFARPGTTASR